MSRTERQRRYRMRHPDKYAAAARRHSARSGSVPGDFGGHRGRRKPWSAGEEARVLEQTIPDRQLAEELDRSLKSIAVRRSQIKRREAAS
jgi:hypothetical protein